MLTFWVPCSHVLSGMMRKRRCSAEVKQEELAVTLLESPKNPRTCFLLCRTCRRPWRTRALNLGRISRDLATMLFVCSSCFHVSIVLIPQVIMMGFQSKTCCFVLHLPCNGSIWRAAGGTLRSHPDPSLLYTNRINSPDPFSKVLAVRLGSESSSTGAGTASSVWKSGICIPGNVDIWGFGYLEISDFLVRTCRVGI